MLSLPPVHFCCVGRQEQDDDCEDNHDGDGGDRVVSVRGETRG